MNNRVGCDETGVGDYLTPIVACALFIPEENLNFIKSLNIKDSKKLSDEYIISIADKLKNNCIYKISYLSQQNYNKLNKYLNAHELKMLLHLQNINYLEKHNIINEIVLDQFSNIKSISKYITKLVNSSLQVFNIKAPLILETHAEDKYLEVACASILARDYLLTKMKEQQELWNFNFPLGAKSDVKLAAKEFIKIYGLENLEKVAKIHFKTTKEIKNEF
ncbi:ribonuclease HIII [Mesomycoplasma lagogenitalium]|uniref:Ribonuclease n=1 Tax=Mesomycoplasma lagogenitalium TaxID=171286 RepID=A0ABY8LT18_9BACT|nr:ribonuclease HIII [Mesomycoplasma lagogenitalium]WGI36385.1 ribonuclease HIII [Mesomycoplasma lagogenitalium]